MTMTRFTEILYELSEELDTPLHPDENNLCRIEINESLFVQLELSSDEHHLMIICVVSELLPGKYREKTLLSLLQANDAVNKQVGIFSFLPKMNLIMLHEKIPLMTIQTIELVELLVQFSGRAMLWRKAFQDGLSHPSGALIEDRGSSSLGNQPQPGLKP
ncbi:MAG: CesT family type III secretion system chaperone [Simkaniaceae bacterium]|nr:CesT family type III secretion system chaperone [Simkaniaceae bacterium]